jgi:hypothetical protein
MSEDNMLIPQRQERYSTALEIARQLNADFSNGRTLKVFNALGKPGALPIVAVGAVGITVAGIVAALRMVTRHERRAAKRDVPAQNRQPVLISETAIQISPVHLVVVSRSRLIEPED